MSRQPLPLARVIAERPSTVVTVGIAALAFIAFGDRLQGDFVWDDVPLIAKNTALVEPGGLLRLLTDDLWGSAGQQSTQLYHPLPMATLWLQAQLHGVAMPWLRLGNVALHVACVLSFVALLVRLGLSRASVVFAATVLLLHPLVTEPVMWLTGRHDTLATLFALLAMLAYPDDTAGRPRMRLLLCALASAAAFASKEPYVVVPVLVVGTSLLEWRSERSMGRLALTWLAPLAGVLSVFALRHALGIPSSSDQLKASLGVHLLSYASIVRHYATLTLTLQQGATIASVKPLALASGTAWLVGAGSALLVLGLARRSVAGRAALFGAAWFLIGLTPHVLSVPILGLWGNRYGYFSLFGAATILASGLHALANRGGAPNLGARLLAVGAALLGLFSTRAGAASFKTDLALYEASVRGAPDDGRAVYHLAHAVRTRRGCEGAIELLERATELDPSYARAQRNVAGCWLNLGHPQRALAAAQRAVELEPKVASHRYNWGAALLGSGARDRGVEQLRLALKLDPEHVPSRRLLSTVAKP